MNFDLDQEIEKATERVHAFIDAKTSDIQRDLSKRIDNYAKQYNRAINHIFFKAVLAEQVGWDGFEMINEEEGIVMMAEIV